MVNTLIVDGCNWGSWIYGWMQMILKGEIKTPGLTHLLLDKMATILAEVIFKRIFLNEMIELLFKFHWNFLPGVQLTIRQHCFRLYRLGAKQATSHYLNQWWPSSLMHIYGTRGRWVNDQIEMKRCMRFKYLNACLNKDTMCRIETSGLTHWPLGEPNKILNNQFQN